MRSPNRRLSDGVHDEARRALGPAGELQRPGDLVEVDDLAHAGLDARAVAAALELLVEPGFDGTTMQAIAKRCDVHASALYRPNARPDDRRPPLDRTVDLLVRMVRPHRS